MNNIQKPHVMRGQRVTTTQKKLLISLIENYIIRMTGRNFTASFDVIEPDAWETFAILLNKWGPKKVPKQWKTSFYYMKNRVRKSVELIRQCGADINTNLSAMDLKLYLLSPPSFSSVEDTELINLRFDHNKSNDYDAAHNDRNLHEDMKGESVAGSSYVEREDEYDHGNDFEENDVRREFVNGICLEQVESGYTAGNSYEEGKEDGVAGNVKNENDSNFVMEFRDSDELNHYLNTPLIVNDEEELHTSSSLHSCGPNAEHEDCLVERGTQEDFSDTFELYPTQTTSASNADFPAMTIIPGLSSEKHLQRREKTTFASESCSKSIKVKRVVETGSKVTEIQKERLVQLVQGNFLKAFGRFQGANGAQIKKSFWQTSAEELNSLGPPRTDKQWQTIFNTIKSSAKTKLADDHNNFSGKAAKPLSRLEEKILSIYGMDCLDGEQTVGEAGFRYQKTIPTARRNCSSTITSGALSSLSSNTETHANLRMDIESQFNEDNDLYAEAGIDLVPNEGNEDRDLLSPHRDEPQFLNESTEDVATSSRGVNVERRTLSPASQNSGNSDHHARQTSATPSHVQSRTVFRHEDVATSSRGVSVERRILSPASQNSRNSDHRARQTSEIPSRFESPTVFRHEDEATSSRGVSVERRTLSPSSQNSGNYDHRTRQTSATSSRVQSRTVFRHEDVATSSRGVSVGRRALSPASQNSGNSDHRSRRTSEIPSRVESPTVSRHRVPENSERDRGSAVHSTRRLTPGVRGVPRLRTHRPRVRREEITEITSVNQFFNDSGEETDAPSHEEARSSARARTAVERDRSNLRHRHTSYETVQRSINAQERFFDDSMRNHSEHMYAMDRNHSEMLGIINNTLSSFTSIAQGILNRM